MYKQIRINQNKSDKIILNLEISSLFMWSNHRKTKEMNENIQSKLKEKEGQGGDDHSEGSGE